MKKRRGLLAAAAVLLAVILAAAAYAGDYYRADADALAALAGTSEVTVYRQGNLTVFSPEEPESGFIFYPGGKVEHTAYAPLLLDLAREDILCVLVKMPLNLAVLAPHAAGSIPEAFPQVETWYIGGHSLGGSMAAFHGARNSDAYAGVALLAAYSTAELQDTQLDVLSIYGDRDQVLNMEKYGKYRSNLPQDTCERVIQGGNHAQFGSYGPQEGDGEAAISGAEQLEITVQQLLALIQN